MAKNMNASVLLAALSKGNASVEDNDLNINIQAEHEGDADNEETGFETEDAPEAGVETETEADAELVEDTSSVPEAAELDAADAGDDVEEATDKVEDVVEAADGLESIMIHLAQLSTEGHTLSQVEGAMIHNHVNYILRKFPRTDATKLGVPAVESFGYDAALSQTSMEAATSGWKGAIAQGVKMVKNILARILAFFKHATSSGEVIRRKAASIYEEAKKAGSDFQVAKEISVPGAFADPQLTPAAVKQLAAAIKGLTSPAYDKFEATLNGPAMSAAAIAAAAKLVDEEVAKHAKGKFIGGFEIIKGDNGLSIKSGEAGDSKKRAGFQASVIADIASQVRELGVAIQEFKKGEAQRKKVGATIEKALAEAQRDPDQGKVAAKFQATKAALASWSRRTSFETQLLNRAIAVGNQVNNILAASLKQPKKEKAK